MVFILARGENGRHNKYDENQGTSMFDDCCKVLSFLFSFVLLFLLFLCSHWYYYRITLILIASIACLLSLCYLLLLQRVYSKDAGVEQVPLGLYIIRGDNIAIVGELDEDIDISLDLSIIRGEPLKPVVH